MKAKKKKNNKNMKNCGKIRDLIRLITKESDDYDENNLKTKFNSDDKLVLNNTIEIKA